MTTEDTPTLLPCATDRATVRHLTTRWRDPAGDIALGRGCLTLCGVQAMDQERLTWLLNIRGARQRHGERRPVPVIATLRLCKSCEVAARIRGLDVDIRRAEGAC